MKTDIKGKTADIILENDLTEEYSAGFINNMKDLIEKDIKRFNLDLSGIKYIDPAALSNLIVFTDSSDLEFCLKNISVPVRNILDTVRLDNRVLFE